MTGNVKRVAIACSIAVVAGILVGVEFDSGIGRRFFASNPPVELTAEPWPSALSSFQDDCPACPVMVVVPGGAFKMGSMLGTDSEAPRHRVTVHSFAIGATEVTKEQWRALMGNYRSEFSACGTNCPVEGITLDDILRFIEKLNAVTGRKYRLPTEAEWEYACRAGNQSPYCGGDIPRPLGWFLENSQGTIHPVGQMQANAYGLYDMNGNVSEWVVDCWHDNYEGAPADGRAWTSREGCAQRVLRGGAWCDSLRNTSSSSRSIDVDGSEEGVCTSAGFRLALTRTGVGGQRGVR